MTFDPHPLSNLINFYFSPNDDMIDGQLSFFFGGGFVRSLHSVAKYCSKKLPAKCAVLAVDSGKIVFRRESNVHSGKVSAEIPGCGDNELYCEVPFLARQCKEEPLPLHEPPRDGGGSAGEEEEEHDVGTKETEPVNAVSGEQQPSGVDPAELSPDQVQGDVDPSDKGEESTADQKDEISELPGEGASVLYCVLPERNGHSAASTSSRQSNDSTEPPTEGNGELYCILPPRNDHSGRSSGDSSRSTASRKHDDSASLSAEGDGELYCRLPRTGHSGRSSGGSKRSFGAKGLIRRSSSFSSDIQKDVSVCTTTTEQTSSMVSTEAEDSPKNAARDVDTPSSSPMSLRRMIEGRPDRCRLRRRIFNHQRSSSFEWAKISMVQWAMRLPSRYTSVADNKSFKSDASPRLNCDSECESTSAVDTESMFSFSLYDISWPPNEVESLQEKYSSTCRLFTYEELKLATSNFSPGNVIWDVHYFDSQAFWQSCLLIFFYTNADMLIGKGGTSQVYKAQLFDGTLSAVKILKPSVDAIQEFVTEVEIATSLQHDNIVSLRGFSSDNYSLVLVYDYMLQGSLDKALHGNP